MNYKIPRPTSLVVKVLTLALLAGPRLAADEEALARALRAKVTQEVIRKWSPEIIFDYHERFFPTSVEDLLRGARLYQEGREAQAQPITSPNDLAHKGLEWRIRFDPKNPKVLAGDRGPGGSVTAPMYVSVQIPADGSYVKLLYRALFGFQGPQSVRCHDGSSNFNYAAPMLGEHEGDWEAVNVFLAPDLGSLLAVTTEAHGNPTNHTPDQLEFTEGTHARIRCAVSSHGMYVRGGNFNIDWFILQDMKVLSVIDQVSGGGPTWQPWKQQNTPFRIIGSARGNEPASEKWATFRGRLGSYKQNTIVQPCELNGRDLGGTQAWKAQMQTGLINTVRTFNFSKDLADTRVGAPTSGPGDRTEMQWSLPSAELPRNARPCVIFSRVPDYRGEKMVLCADPKSADGRSVLAPHRKGDAWQQWYIVDVGGGRVQIVNRQTRKCLRYQGGQGKDTTLFPVLMDTPYTTWTIAGDRKNNCAIRPALTDRQNLNAFGNGPYPSGNRVGTWDWSRGQGNETWRIVEE